MSIFQTRQIVHTWTALFAFILSSTLACAAILSLVTKSRLSSVLRFDRKRKNRARVRLSSVSEEVSYNNDYPIRTPRRFDLSAFSFFVRHTLSRATTRIFHLARPVSSFFFTLARDESLNSLRVRPSSRFHCLESSGVCPCSFLPSRFFLIFVRPYTALLRILFFAQLALALFSRTSVYRQGRYRAYNIITTCEIML